MNKNKKNLRDAKPLLYILFVFILGYTSYYAIVHPQYSLLYDKLWIYILTGVCFFIAISIKNKIQDYGLIIAFVFISVSFTKLMTISTGTGALAALIISISIAELPGIFIKNMFIPVSLGYVLALTYSYLLNIISKSLLLKRLITTSLFIMFLIMSAVLFYPLKMQHNPTHKLNKELFSKYTFAEEIAYAIYSKKIAVIDNNSIIKNKLYKDIYTLKNDNIIHGYGGKVKVEQHQDVISITYENIPPNNVCAEFYYKKPIDNFGFTAMEFNKKPSVRAGITKKGLDKERADNCYTGAKNFSIKFTGSVQEIKNLPSTLFDGLLKRRAEELKNKDVNFSKVFDINYSNDKSILYN